MTEGRRCQVHLLDDRKLELLVQVSASSSHPPALSSLSSLSLYRFAFPQSRGEEMSAALWDLIIAGEGKFGWQWVTLRFLGAHLISPPPARTDVLAALI